MPPALTRRSAIALAAACLSSLMFGLEISSIPAILPTLEQVLHADFKQLLWIMNAYTIAVTTVLMATGTLGLTDLHVIAAERQKMGPEQQAIGSEIAARQIDEFVG